MCIWAEHLRLDHQRGQARELVLWSEAVGMVPQLAAIADDYGIPVFSSGGFDSVTAKYDLAVEWRHAGPITMLHIGDQDPSGVINFEALAGDLIRRRGEDPRLLRSAPATRQNHHARHLVDNPRVFRDDARHARAAGVMSLYRADGSPPFQGARPPAMIADFEAQCVLGDDRLWRFQSHVLRPIFVGSDVPISLSIDPQRL